MRTLFSNHIRWENLHFKYARGASDRSGKEFHIYHEIILFLDGDGEFVSENRHIQLRPSTLIVIPRETYHQMVIHGDQERYHRCVLQFDQSQELSSLAGSSLKEVLTLEADQEIRYLFDKLIAASEGAHPDREAMLKAVLVLLLDAIRSKKNMLMDEYPQNATVRLAVEYINRNLGRPLSIREIAQVCSVSASSLSHIFKKEMYCPVHKFIVKKRLIRAYHRIAAGEAPTTAAVECGFQDYSGFYKQYKKAFGFPPSQKS